MQFYGIEFRAQSVTARFKSSKNEGAVIILVNCSLEGEYSIGSIT